MSIELPIELEIKDTTDTARSALYLDLHLEIDRAGQSRTKLYYKIDDSILLLLTFPFFYLDIP